MNFKTEGWSEIGIDLKKACTEDGGIEFHTPRGRSRQKNDAIRYLLRELASEGRAVVRKYKESMHESGSTFEWPNGVVRIEAYRVVGAQASVVRCEGGGLIDWDGPSEVHHEYYIGAFGQEFIESGRGRRVVKKLYEIAKRYAIEDDQIRWGVSYPGGEEFHWPERTNSDDAAS